METKEGDDDEKWMEVEQITATNTEERHRGSAPVSGYDYWLNDDDDNSNDEDNTI